VEEQQLRAQQALVEAENLRPDLAVLVEKCGKSWHDAAFFQRASERRVLPIVGVCKTSSHLHIFSSSHLLIFASSQPHIFSSSHLLIFTSSHPHLHICSSSHLVIFTSAHLHILTSSHLLIFTSSHLHTFTFSLALLLSCPLALSFFSISLLKARGSANETARNATLSHEMRFDRQKLK